MNMKLVDYLNQSKPNQEAIEVATRSFLSELTQDLPPSKMKREMLGIATDRQALEGILLELENSPDKRLHASLETLEWAWENPNNREKIDAAFKGAESKLPAIEAALLALVAMYGMYLIATGGQREKRRTVERAKDGTFKETITTVYERPIGPLAIVPKLFGARIDDK